MEEFIGAMGHRRYFQFFYSHRHGLLYSCKMKIVGGGGVEGGEWGLGRDSKTCVKELRRMPKPSSLH